MKRLPTPSAWELPAELIEVAERRTEVLMHRSCLSQQSFRMALVNAYAIGVADAFSREPKSNT